MDYAVQRSDKVGALASALCLVHCIATPLLFVAQSSKSACAVSPLWWQFIDYLFLLVSFAAIYRSTRTTSIKWMPAALWSSWSLLFLVILNERLDFICLPGVFYFIPAISIIALHLYNQKYCECSENEFCTTLTSP